MSIRFDSKVKWSDEGIGDERLWKGRIRRWKKSGVEELVGLEQAAEHAALQPDGRVAISHGPTVRTAQVTGLKYGAVESKTFGADIRALDMARGVIAASLDRHVLLLDEALREKGRLPSESPRSLVLHRDSSLLLALRDRTWTLWNLSHAEAPVTAQTPSKQPLETAAWSPTDATVFAVGGRTGHLWLHDLRSHPMAQTSEESSGSFGLAPLWRRKGAMRSAIRSLAWSPHCGSWLASGSAEGAVQVWDIRYGSRPIFSAGESNLAGIRSLAWSPSHPTLLVSGAEDGQLTAFGLTLDPPSIVGRVGGYGIAESEAIWFRRGGYTPKLSAKLSRWVAATAFLKPSRLAVVCSGMGCTLLLENDALAPIRVFPATQPQAEEEEEGEREAEDGPVDIVAQAIFERRFAYALEKAAEAAVGASPEKMRALARLCAAQEAQATPSSSEWSAVAEPPLFRLSNGATTTPDVLEAAYYAPACYATAMASVPGPYARKVSLLMFQARMDAARGEELVQWADEVVDKAGELDAAVLVRAIQRMHGLSARQGLDFGARILHHWWTAHSDDEGALRMLPALHLLLFPTLFEPDEVFAALAGGGMGGIAFGQNELLLEFVGSGGSRAGRRAHSVVEAMETQLRRLQQFYELGDYGADSLLAFFFDMDSYPESFASPALTAAAAPNRKALAEFLAQRHFAPFFILASAVQAACGGTPFRNYLLNMMREFGLPALMDHVRDVVEPKASAASKSPLADLGRAAEQLLLIDRYCVPLPDFVERELPPLLAKLAAAVRALAELWARAKGRLSAEDSAVESVGAVALQDRLARLVGAPKNLRACEPEFASFLRELDHLRPILSQPSSRASLAASSAVHSNSPALSPSLSPSLAHRRFSRSTRSIQEDSIRKSTN